jgi:TonB family protein
MFTYIIQISICWGVLYLLYLALFSRNTFFTANRIYLGSSIVLGMILPVVASSVAGTIALPVDIEVTAYLPTILVSGSSEITIPYNAPVEENGNPYWVYLLWPIYLLGIIVGGYRFSLGLWKIRQLYKGAEIIPCDQYTMVLTEAVHVPFSFFRLLFWSKRQSFDPKDQKRIIQHEQAHIRGWHSLDVVSLELLRIIFWPSPMIYLYSRSMRAVHEFLADAAVLKTTIKKKQYGHLLLRQSQSGMSIALANHFFHSQLKKRIIMMTKAKSKQHLLGRYFFALPVVVLLTMAFAMPLNKPLNYEDTIGEGILPVFAGCEALESKKEQQQCSKEKLVAFIQEKLQYPKQAKEAGKEGQVLVEFTVNKEGYVENATVINRIGFGMDEAALRVVNAMPRWMPAQENGKAVSTKLTLPFNFALPSSEAADDVLEVVDEMPRFPGCESETDVAKREECSQLALLKHLYGTLKYPKDAMKADAEGTVVASFVVNKEGYLEDIKVVRSVYPSLDAQVLTIIKSMNEMPDRWIPGKQEGEVVKVRYNLPVKFKLDSDKKSSDKVEETLKLNRYSVSPNPSNGRFNISFEAEAQPIGLRMIDINGQVLWQAHIDDFSGNYNKEIDLGASAKGTLILQVKQGGKIFSDKISAQ